MGGTGRGATSIPDSPKGQGRYPLDHSPRNHTLPSCLINSLALRTEMLVPARSPDPRERPMSRSRTCPPLSARARHHLLWPASSCLWLYLAVSGCLSLSTLGPKTYSEQEEGCGLPGPREGEDIGAEKESVRQTGKTNSWITGIVLH